MNAVDSQLPSAPTETETPKGSIPIDIVLGFLKTLDFPVHLARAVTALADPDKTKGAQAIIAVLSTIPKPKLAVKAKSLDASKDVSMQLINAALSALGTDAMRALFLKEISEIRACSIDSGYALQAQAAMTLFQIDTLWRGENQSLEI